MRWILVLPLAILCFAPLSTFGQQEEGHHEPEHEQDDDHRDYHHREYHRHQDYHHRDYHRQRDRSYHWRPYRRWSHWNSWSPSWQRSPRRYYRWQQPQRQIVNTWDVKATVYRDLSPRVDGENRGAEPSTCVIESPSPVLWIRAPGWFAYARASGQGSYTVRNGPAYRPGTWLTLEIALRSGQKIWKTLRVETVH